MSGLQTLEPSAEPVPTPLAARPRRRFPWRLLVAPLLGISVVLHIGLLFVPLPAWESVSEAEEAEPPPEEEDTTEIISLNDIPGTPETAEPPPSTEQPQQPPPANPSAGAPPRPDQIPEDFAAIEDGEEQNQSLTPEDLPPEGPSAFDPDRQQALAGGARSGLTGTSFGQLNGDPAAVARYLDNYWNSGRFSPVVPQDCFFAGFSDRPQLVPGAYDVLISNRNVDIFRNQDLPGLITGQLVDQGLFCNAPLYEVQENGLATSFISVLGVGTGNTSSAVVIFWSQDPR